MLVIYKHLKGKLRVFNRLTYGNQRYHENDHNLLSNDQTFDVMYMK